MHKKCFLSIEKGANNLVKSFLINETMVFVPLSYLNSLPKRNYLKGKIDKSDLTNELPFLSINLIK